MQRINSMTVAGLVVMLFSATLMMVNTAKAEQSAADREAEALGVVLDGFLGNADPAVRREAQENMRKQVNEWHGEKREPSQSATSAARAAPAAQSGYQRTYSDGNANGKEEARCHHMVQDRVAWNWKGDRQWNSANINDLCNNTQSAETTIICFEGVMAVRDDWRRAINACGL
ncbi:MAG: hypothetical protein ACPG1C_10150 [Alphaproteobacteria bacterium]